MTGFLVSSTCEGSAPGQTNNIPGKENVSALRAVPSEPPIQNVQGDPCQCQDETRGEGVPLITIYRESNLRHSAANV